MCFTTTVRFSCNGLGTVKSNSTKRQHHFCYYHSLLWKVKYGKREKNMVTRGNKQEGLLLSTNPIPKLSTDGTQRNESPAP